MRLLSRWYHGQEMRQRPAGRLDAFGAAKGRDAGVISFVPVSVENFKDFSEPGYAKTGPAAFDEFFVRV
jgi:hypothetical protein